MRVIAKGTLAGFVRHRVEPGQQKAVQAQLDIWYQQVSLANWKNSAELKAQIRSASILSAERVVFNIKGNDFRLVAAIDYESKFLLVKWLGTHKEYDQLDVQKVKYDAGRYSGSTD